MVGWASRPCTAKLLWGLAVLLGPATGPPSGGMQAASRPRDSGKKTLRPLGSVPGTSPQDAGRGRGDGAVEELGLALNSL